MPKHPIHTEGKETRFSKDYQPAQYRKKAPLTQLLIQQLESEGEIIIEGLDIETGELRKVKVKVPDKKTLALAIMKEAKKGNVKALEMIWNRIEGKEVQPVEITNSEKINYDFTKLTEDELNEFDKCQARIQQLISKCSPGMGEVQV